MRLLDKEFDDWAAKVRKNKRDELDIKMFDELVKQARMREDRGENIVTWLHYQHVEFKGSRFVGGRLMETNSKLLHDKLWSMNRKRGGQ